MIHPRHLVKELYCAHAEDLLSTRIAPAAAETPTPASDEQFLRTLFAEFNEYNMAALLVRDILMYLDRVYIPVARVPNSYRMGLNTFGDVVLDAVAARVQTAFCESIRRERMGELVDRRRLRMMKR